MRLQRLRGAIDQPGERPGTAASPPSRKMSPGIGAVRRPAEPRPVEARKQRSGVAVADIGLVPGGFRQPADHCLRDPAGAIAAAGAPDRVEGRVVGDLEEGLRPRRIVAGEMAVGLEALRMEVDFRCCAG